MPVVSTRWPDNPFFTLFLRRSRRNIEGRFQFVAVLLGILALPVLAAVVLRGSTEAPRLSYWWLAVPHGFFIVVLVIADAQAILRDEQRRQTLEFLRLLPSPPGQRLWLKTWPALLSLATYWAAGLPFYLAFAALDLAPVGLLPRFAGLVLFAGIVALLSTLLLSANPKLNEDSPGEGSVALMLALFALTLPLVFLIGRGRGLTSPVYVFTASVPGWLPIGAAFTALAGAAVTSALAALTADPDRERRASRWRFACMMVCAVLILAQFWFVFPLQVQWILGVLGGISAALLLLTLALSRWMMPAGAARPPLEPAWPVIPRPPSHAGWPSGASPFVPPSNGEPRSEPEVRREIEWLSKRWDNPMLVRDLRSRRFKAPIRGALVGGAVNAALAFACAWTVWYFLLSRWAGTSLAPFWYLLGQPFNWLTSAGAEAETRWKQERESGSLALLILLPMPSADFLAGRMWACALHGVAGILTPLLIAVLLCGWASLRHWSGALPLAALFLGLLACLWTGRGCCVAPSPARTSEPLWAVQLLAFAAGVAGVVFSTWRPWWAVWLLALVILAGHLALALGWFRCRVRQFDRLRRGDIDEVIERQPVR
jgi:hypothetical protein